MEPATQGYWNQGKKEGKTRIIFIEKLRVSIFLFQLCMDFRKMAISKFFDYSNLHSSSPDVLFVNIGKTIQNLLNFGVPRYSLKLGLCLEKKGKLQKEFKGPWESKHKRKKKNKNKASPVNLNAKASSKYY